MLRKYFIGSLFIILLLMGCAQSTAAYPNPETETPTSTSLPILSRDWKIKMTHSGGIMGLLRSVEVSADGKYTVTDERASQTFSGELGANELAKLVEVISTSEYISPSGPEGMVCADCFVYDLEIQGSDSTLTIQLNDINLPDSGMAPVVGYMRGLIDKALK
jgi:hypothetical protein